MANEIPADALEKAAALVQALREQLRPVVDKLPAAPACAFQFRVRGGEECE